MKEYDPLVDEDYIELLQAVVTYCILKHYNGIFQISQSMWESATGSFVGGSLHVTFDEDMLTVSVARGRDAEA